MLSRMVVDMIRKNTLDFLKQEAGSTVALMPMLPKRLLLMCDTIDELYEVRRCSTDAPVSQGKQAPSDGANFRAGSA